MLYICTAVLEFANIELCVLKRMCIYANSSVSNGFSEGNRQHTVFKTRCKYMDTDGAMCSFP